MFSLFTQGFYYKIWLKLTIILIITYLVVLLWRTKLSPLFSKIWTPYSPFTEGFSQSRPYVAKYESDIYDDFYVDIYDTLHDTCKVAAYQTISIISNTQSTPRKSIILDVGSKTGKVTDEFQNRGYSEVYGLETHPVMLAHSHREHPNINIKKGDSLDPMLYERGVFSHILCLNHNIYEYNRNDKETLLNNCYNWLRPGGYMVIQLVDDKYDTRVQAAKSALYMYDEKQVLDYNIKMTGFNYRRRIHPHGPQTTVTETFTDDNTHHVRENEFTMYIDPANDILNIAKNCGFTIKGKENMENMNKDNHQYLYFLERTM
jgi:SAM-dependent methyltransferase